MQSDNIESIERLGSWTAARVAEDLASGKLKAILMERLREMHRSRGMTQVEAARWFGVTQPRISHLAQNRTDRFTVDTLINMLAHAGVRLSFAFENTRDDENQLTDPSRSRGVRK
jgi:predicted XRE-type DNA-binding protein